MADYISVLYKERKQDSVIFFGTEPRKEWLNYIEMLEPLIFRSDCPIFMPGEVSNMVELRLDSNILFFENEKDGRYRLDDKFAVKGGPHISLELGDWDEVNGFSLKRSLNRWDRRTDLKGATFKNNLQGVSRLVPQL